MLLDYLPPYLQEIREYQILGETGDTQKAELDWAVSDVKAAPFVETAREPYLKRFESMLGIQPSPGNTVEQRRSEILMRFNEHPPYTKRFLYRTLVSLCGEDGFRLTISCQQQSIDLLLDSSHWQIDRVVKELMERVLPLNLVWLVRYLYQAGEIQNREQFLPRTKHRMEFLWWPTGTMLNGTFLLDGSTLLNKVLTEYPMRSRHRLELRSLERFGARSRTGGITVLLKEGASMPALRNRMLLDPQMQMEFSGIRHRESISEAIPPSTVRPGIRMEVPLQESAMGNRSVQRMEVVTRETAVSESLRYRLWMAFPQETIKPSVKLPAIVLLKEAAQNQAARNRGVWSVSMGAQSNHQSNRAEVRTKETVQTADVVINKNLWYMDGTTRLDGSQLLNAYTKTEEW